MSIILVACLDMNNGIGDSEGNLLFDLPKDMRHFKSITSNKHVVMGRKTWDSLPKKPLPKRKNYVLTMDETFEAEGATVLHSIDEVLELAKTKDVYCIGGGELYHQLIDDADNLIITFVHVAHPNARVHFPDFEIKDWKMIGSPTFHKKDESHLHDFAFTTYERK